ncbi:TPA: hypothetical protein HA265_04600 [Candidatus Woesearchaeota archaeon]|nr:hypothetical protein [Candidatus Woesearchaeota archaeon]
MTSEKITFACGSSGHPDYCPGECQFGRFCRFLKDRKPKAMRPDDNPVIRQIKKDIQRNNMF